MFDSASTDEWQTKQSFNRVFGRLLDVSSIQSPLIRDLLSPSSAISNALSNYKSSYKSQMKTIAKIGRGRVISNIEINAQSNPKYPVYSSQTTNNGVMGYLDSYDYQGEYLTWTTDGANAGTVFYRNGKFNCTNVCGVLKINSKHNAYYVGLCLQKAAQNMYQVI